LWVTASAVALAGLLGSPGNSARRAARLCRRTNILGAVFARYRTRVCLKETGEIPAAGVLVRMKLYGVRPALAVSVFAAAALAACGGGGGGGGTGGPPPVVTPTPSGGYVAPSGGVTQLGPSTTFSSSLLGASADGTFVVQSGEAPAEPPASSATLTEYDVTAAESAPGQKPSSANRTTTAQRSSLDVAPLPFRIRMDYRAAALRSATSRTFTALGRVRSVESGRHASDLTAGATRTFHVLQGTITGTGGTCTPPQQSVGTQCYLDVPATLQYVSAHAYVWADNAFDASYGLGSADWQATGLKFDAAYAKETVTFGPAFFHANVHYTQCTSTGSPAPTSQTPVDLSGTDPHVSLIVTRALENTGEGGYFYSPDLLTDQEFNCATKAPHVPTNGLPLIVLGADKYQNNQADESFWRTVDMPRTVAHEFQHYLHAIGKEFIPNLVNNQPALFDDSFVDEGDSMLAQDLVNGTAQAQDVVALEAGFDYLYSPANYSLTAFTGYAPDPLDTSTNPAFGFFHNTLGNYGAAYLFQRYLYDRFGGDAAMHRQYATLTSTASGANVNPVLAEAGNGESFAQLYADFAAALAARNVASTDPRFSFSPAVLLVGTKQVPVQGGQTWDIVLNGPRSPADLTNAHPFATGTTRIKLTPNTTVSAKLITGATLFFNAAPSPGSITSLVSTSAPGGTVQGALVQGAYNDNGSCFGPPSSGC
jgi:hypothetical protein